MKPFEENWQQDSGRNFSADREGENQSEKKSFNPNFSSDNKLNRSSSDDAGAKHPRRRVGESRLNVENDYSGNKPSYRQNNNDYQQRGRGDYDNNGGGYNGGGGYNNNRSAGGYSNNRSGGYNNNRGGSDYTNNRGGGDYNNNRGGGDYNNNRGGGYNNNRGGGYNNNRGGYNNNSGYNNNNAGYNNNEGYNNEGGYSNNNGGYGNNNGGYNNNRGGGYNNNRGGGYNNNRADGYNNNRGDGNRRPQFNNNRNNNNRFPQRNNNNNQRYNPNPQRQVEYRSIVVDPNEPIRLNKFLANAGVCSRREADELIQAGVVSVNGAVVSELGTKILRGDKVMIHDQLVAPDKKVYVLLNKPKDCVTTSDDPYAKLTVMDLVKNACRERIYPVGRLDRNTTGVLLLTNDGDLAAKLTHPKYNKKKIYQVSLDKPLEKEDFDKLIQGITLEDGEIKADELNFFDETDMKKVGIEIHSGRNRIVRRLFEHVGYRVTRLDRVYFAGLTKKNLRRGQWRFLTEREVNMLRMGAFE
ncbi:MAG TPA: pseudouridine synthase [Paludibacteraceae bacterium]|jgi:23S rRNA pseudouridine2605 synthase|nr:pseudouridine synthase [Paludibacteraceae bacterium]